MRKSAVFPVLFLLARSVTLVIGLKENMEVVPLVLVLTVPAAMEIALYLAVLRWVRPRIVPRFSRAADLLANLVYAFLLITDMRVLGAFQRPLDLALLSEGTAAMSAATMLSLLSWLDLVFISIALLTVFVPQHRFFFHYMPRTLHACGVSLLLLAAAHVALPGSALPAYATASPVLRIPGLLAVQGLASLTGGITTLSAAAPLRFDPRPAGLPAAYHAGRIAGKETPNILFIVLESTGSRYVFDEKLTLPGAGVPMPFLKKLSRESLNLTHHYATANSSPRALFSLFTGLYPEPADEFFSLKRGLKIKTWSAYFKDHKSLLVTPCATEWYFPNGLFRNNGLTEIIGKSKLNFSETRTEPTDARNEIQSADYFAERLRTLAEPFFSVYISFAPHYPYHDYGPEWRITAGRSRLDRYVDNLRLLDAQLQKFFTVLEKRGVLKNTVVVLVGDHSEAFKQHPGNYIHSLHSYEENLAVPAMIWSPGRIMPRDISEPTSHVDIGPTVLDLLGIGHAPADFQGVSLLRHADRRHIYAYGNEGTVTVYDRALRKTQRLKNAACRQFDLQTDAAEIQPQSCEKNSEAYRNATAFAAAQLPFLQQLAAGR